MSKKEPPSSGIKSFYDAVAEYKQKELDKQRMAQELKSDFFENVIPKYYKDIEVDPRDYIIKLDDLGSRSDLTKYREVIETSDLHKFAETTFKQYLIEVGILKENDSTYVWKSYSEKYQNGHFRIGLMAYNRNKCIIS